MARRKVRPLGGGYSVETDRVDEAAWNHLMQQFDDSSLNQTWAFGAAMNGPRGIGHQVLRFQGEVAALSQVRIKELPLPFAGCGIAYVSWGPMWQRAGSAVDREHFRQAVRALRNEYVCRRGLTLRLFPLAFEDDPHGLSEILAEEGFAPRAQEAGDRTLLMDIAPSLEALRKGMEANWRRWLRISENSGLEIVEGTGAELVDEFMALYSQMVSRKGFLPSGTLPFFRAIQHQLPEELRLKILLCRAEGRVCAGLVASTTGTMATELFAATNELAKQNHGAYLLRWRFLEELKGNGKTVYNLNGINPEENPGTFRFKKGLAGRNGRDVYYLGKFDAGAGPFRDALTGCADRLRHGLHALRRLAALRRGRNAPG